MESNTITNKQWSTPIPQSSKSNTTAIHRCFDPTISPTIGARGCSTLYEALRRGKELNPLGPCLGFRAVSTSGHATPYVYSNYVEVVARVDSFAAGLEDLGLLERNEDGLLLMGIYMKNCMEWVIGEHGLYSIGGATVPLYDTLGPDSVSFVLNQTNLACCVCTRAELPNLCAAKLNHVQNLPKFRAVILVDGVTPEAAKQCQEAGIPTCTSFARVETHGAHKLSSTQYSQQPHKHNPPSGDDIATFCYTSGTTGNPKGALLTHTNLLSSMAGLDVFFLPNATDRHLSYLPLPHIFERMVLGQMLLSGASVGFFRGDPTKLIEDLQACRPTILPAAPRVLNKIYDKITAGMHAAGGLKLALFQRALQVKTHNLKQHGVMTHALYDKLIFNKIKTALGMDCLRFVVSGSAPLSEHVMLFFRCLLGCPVSEGYGQTEGSAAATLSHLSDVETVGHVGGPIGCTEIVLVDVPEMGYLCTDTSHRGKPCRGRGEIWVRGPNVFKGYYKDEEKTKETVDEEGWLHSGDIGLWTMSGALQIIDRKKNIFKLAQGEYVAAEKIENILTQSLYIAQCFVYGDSYQSSLVAIIVPEEEVVTKWAADSENPNLVGSDMKALCQGEPLRTKIMSEVKTLAKTNGLHGFEIPKAIYLEWEPFTGENGLVTPTFKLKRQQLRDFYQSQIDDMYAKMPPPPSKL